ncbi:TPA: hypothetical protein ACS62Z_001678, partial [Klebsiella pneumoniae]
MAEVPLPTPTDNAVPSTDIRDSVYAGAMLDKVVTSTDLTYTDRLGGEHYTVDGMKAEGDKVVEETRQNLIPLSRQYMTLADAQADIANIPEGSTTYVRSSDDSALAFEVMNVDGTLQPTGRQMPSTWIFAGVRFLSGYGDEKFVIIGTDYQVLDYGSDSDRMRDAGADIKYGYGIPGKPLSVMGSDNQMASFLTTDSLEDAGCSILKGYSSSPFAILGSDDQLLLPGSGGSQAASSLPETGLLDYMIAMQERAYTGGYLTIFCQGDSLTAGTGGLGAIDAMYSLFAANLGHGGIGYFAPSN